MSTCQRTQPRPKSCDRAVADAAVFGVIDLLGGGAGGVIVVFVLLVIGCFLLWRANRAKPVEPEETISEHPAFGTVARPEAVAA